VDDDQCVGKRGTKKEGPHFLLIMLLDAGKYRGGYVEERWGCLKVGRRRQWDFVF